ncbi:uncharacterized protein ACA1_144040 [Acanthamoeba castellanii str. Neff]|jgi:uncharacterized protein YjbJ (UPF0337 family)|uniref:CsbD family protein n=1 Tax=Acanthamoeba castellanii (strain ATCC 30010 / Neff) TaxID=1257118 RepID=L8HH46_ACACF|nr:uncharacterized protein ACA1_144040 [Acanthamoeba castellanii str. Neff]ELR24013.1 hypothetical protein ACA1_144040 [Acanthamoeba castellanii str. Neff]
MSNTSNEPSMLSGHVQYVKGAAEEVIGNMTGSEDWKRSGLADKEAARAEMRAANEGPKDPGLVPGQIESTLGRAVGCEGMIENGEEKQRLRSDK